MQKFTFTAIFMILSAITPSVLKADSSCCQHECCGNAYLKLGSGASFALDADVSAPTAFWSPAIEGYNANLGVRPIAEVGFGYEFSNLLSAELSLSYRPQYEYRKKQTVTPDSTTPASFTSITRQFDLDVGNLMFSIFLSGRGFDCLNWSLGCIPGSIYPILGGGVGVGRLLINNFRGINLPAVSPSDPFPAFSSENQYTVRYRPVYQVMAGLEYRYCDKWAVSVGYRWLDYGRFKGPRFVRIADGTALDTTDNEWRIRFAANEAFVEFKWFFQ